MEKYLKISFSIVIVHVITQANIQFYTWHTLMELFGKTDDWQQIYKQTNSVFYLC